MNVMFAMDLDQQDAIPNASLPRFMTLVEVMNTFYLFVRNTVF